MADTYAVIDSVTDTTITGHMVLRNYPQSGIGTLNSYTCEYSISASTIPPPGSPSVPVNVSDGTFTITGLTPGTRYFIYARATFNPPSGSNTSTTSFWVRSTAVTWLKIANYLNSIAHAAEDSSHNIYFWKKAVVFVRYQGVWHVAKPWAKIAGVWKECG